MKQLVAGLGVLLAVSVRAVEVGEVIGFAADGGLREVVIARQLSPTTFLGGLDGYGDSLNATLVETEDGWRMEIDDWRADRLWTLVERDGNVDVSFRPKPAVRRAGCRPIVLSPAASQSSADGALAKKSTSGYTAGWDIDPVTNEVDILVVFDKSAIRCLSSVGRETLEYAEAQVAKMNLVISNSRLGNEFKMRLVGVMNGAFDVTKDCGRDEDAYLEKAIDLATESDLEVWKAVRAERDRLGADVVVILGDSCPDVRSDDEIGGTVGIAFSLYGDRYRLTKYGLDNGRENAYAACNVRVVAIDCTFAHEVGHLMGAGHSDLLDRRYSAPGPQLFYYSAALMYRDGVDGEYYFTVMGYDSTDGGFWSPTYKEVPYYSSPYLAHPVTGSALGDSNHDNVETLRKTYAIISQYRVNAARREGAADGFLGTVPVGAYVSEPLPDLVYRRASSLPAGVKWDAKSAKLVGSPRRAGDYKIRFRLNGEKDVYKTLSVIALPSWMVGAFYGSDEEENADLEVKVTGKGRTTGRLVADRRRKTLTCKGFTSWELGAGGLGSTSTTLMMKGSDMGVTLCFEPVDTGFGFTYGIARDPEDGDEVAVMSPWKTVGKGFLQKFSGTFGDGTKKGTYKVKWTKQGVVRVSGWRDGVKVAGSAMLLPVSVEDGVVTLEAHFSFRSGAETWRFAYPRANPSAVAIERK